MSPSHAPVVPQTSSAQPEARTVSAVLSRPLSIAPITPETTITPRTIARSRRAHASRSVRLRQLVEHFYEQPPKRLARRDAQALVRRVRRLDLRPERDHVEARDLVPDHRRLEAGVYGRDDGRPAELPLVRALRRGER